MCSPCKTVTAGRTYDNPHIRQVRHAHQSGLTFFGYDFIIKQIFLDTRGGAIHALKLGYLILPNGGNTVKKQQILDAAARLFAERGFARTSTSQLAREAGVAEGTIFRHFRSKEEILLELLRGLCARITTDVIAYLEVEGPQTGLEKITAALRACYVFIRKNRSVFALALRDAPGCYNEPDSPTFERLREVYSLLFEYFRSGIEEGQCDGTVRANLHPADTACLLASALMGLMRVVHLGFLTPSDDMLKHFVQSTEAMLKA